MTSNRVSIGPAWVESASPNQLNWSSTTEVTAAITSIAAISLR